MKSSKTGNELELLRETYLVSDSSLYHHLTEDEYKKYDIHGDREKLSESLQNSKITDETLKKIVEELKSTSKNSVWKVPISKFTKNGNGRIYNRQLWENVINKQRNNWQRLYGLMDHPKGDADPGTMKDIASVWHDMMIEGDTVWGVCSLVGPHGRLIDEILTCGGRAGTSTSGFGEVDKYTKIVDPDTFVCERASDWVINPSQGTYATIDCPHTAGDFLNDVHQGATLEFGKQKVQEAQNIVRSKIMATKFDAAATPILESASAQSTSGVQELKENTQKRVLSKMEEKFYRKTVEKLLEDTGTMENPIARLNECIDILDCFEDGLLPDLKESLEKNLLEQKEKLEALIEKVTTTEKDFGMDIKTFREAAERNTAQGLILKEQVTDYKLLLEGLQERNKELKEENEKLKEKLVISEKLTEKKIVNANKEIVQTSTEFDKLKEVNEKANAEILNLKDQVSKLSEGNKQFEKENGVLNTKLKEASEIIRLNKENRLQEEEISKTAFSDIQSLKEKIEDLSKTNVELDKAYTIQSDRFDKLQETFVSYKQQVADTYNPVARLMPNSTERVGKYLNLRENKAIEIENYWTDLKETYGEAIDPFEKYIRDAKTLREATNAFLKYRTQIDSDFMVSQPAEYNYHNRAERAKMYEHLGMINPTQEYINAPIEQKNSEFLAKLQAQGLK